MHKRGSWLMCYCLLKWQIHYSHGSRVYSPYQRTENISQFVQSGKGFKLISLDVISWFVYKTVNDCQSRSSNMGRGSGVHCVLIVLNINSRWIHTLIAFCGQTMVWLIKLTQWCQLRSNTQFNAKFTLNKSLFLRWKPAQTCRFYIKPAIARRDRNYYHAQVCPDAQPLTNVHGEWWIQIFCTMSCLLHAKYTCKNHKVYKYLWIWSICSRYIFFKMGNPIHERCLKFISNIDGD